jgi:SAM-dependent MidA family methyltransferase
LTELEQWLRERIRAEGSVSFRDVMQAALYHPQYGYYTNLRGFGAEGDFITSPECHPAFGWLLGRQALDVWEALGRPLPFNILELGAGSGALAESLTGFLREHVSDIRYTIDELSPSLRSVQQRRLVQPMFRWDKPAESREHAEPPEHAESREPGEPAGAHFIVANEVADALPVHRVVRRDGRFRELRVALDDHGAFTWVEADNAPHDVDVYFTALNYLPPEGHVVDVSLGLPAWVSSIALRLDQRGVALILDYTASPPRDSLLTYYRHTLGSDPFVRLGQQDLSAHVDFRTLVRVALAEGLRAGATAQRGLLLNLGFEQVVSRLTGPTDRQALAQLVDPNAMGGQIAAAFLIRGLPDYRPAGAVGRPDWPPPHHIPSLPPNDEEQAFLDQWREVFEDEGDEH